MKRDDRSIAKTVEKALRIIEIFRNASRDLGITELARLVRINSSTVQRLVNTLAEHGYLQQNPADSAYRLGTKFLEISHVVLQRIDLRAIARPVLEALRDQTGETVHMMVLNGDMGVYVLAVESRQSSRVVSPVGSRDDLHSSAVGKALLAFLPEPQVDAVIAQHGLRRKTQRTITEPGEFKRHLGAIRALGYTIDDEEGEEGTRCVGAPIFDHTGRVVASISVAGPAQRMGRRRIRQLGPLVIRAARSISEQIGSRGEPLAAESSSQPASAWPLAQPPGPLPSAGRSTRAQASISRLPSRR
jgi:IclR family acetate operon transcriptional repressor